MQQQIQQNTNSELKQLKEQLLQNTLNQTNTYQGYLNSSAPLDRSFGVDVITPIINPDNFSIDIKSSDSQFKTEDQSEILLELAKYKEMVSVLKAEMEELTKKESKTSDDKMRLLENKKDEIRVELSRVKEEHKMLEEKIDINTRSENSLEMKKREILKLIEQYDYKIFNEEQLIVVSSKDLVMMEGSLIYKYRLPYVLENVMQITLMDQNIDNNIYNVTPYNNILKICNLDDYEGDDKIGANYKYESIDGVNYLEMNVDPGKYDLDSLVVEINKVLSKFNIDIGYDAIKSIVYIKTKDDREIKLVNNENNIYNMLGIDILDVTDGKKSLFRGKRPADLRVYKQLNINIMNIGNGSTLGKVNVSQDKIISGMMIIKPTIKKLEYIEFKFMCENGRPYWFGEDPNYNFTLLIKGMKQENEKSKYINEVTIRTE